MPRYLRLCVLIALGFTLTVRSVGAATITDTLPEFSGDATFTVGTFNFAIPTGEVIVGASISGTFGNSLSPTSAPISVLLDGIQVTSCLVDTPCTDIAGPHPWSYAFAPAELAIFSDGAATLGGVQQGCCVVRLGVTTLTLTTREDSTSVPEPSSLLLLGTAAVGLAASQRRRGRTRSSVRRN